MAFVGIGQHGGNVTGSSIIPGVGDAIPEIPGIAGIIHAHGGSLPVWVELVNRVDVLGI